MNAKPEDNPASLGECRNQPDGRNCFQTRKKRIRHGKLARLLMVLAGIILGQLILYGPSLIGQKILLPLDLLTVPKVYNPVTPETAAIIPRNAALTDPIIQFEPDRVFAASEIEHGRFPTWAPFEYGGVPFIWPKFSPFLFLTILTKSPVVIAWSQLFTALVAGTGMYCFCRRGLRLGFWPSTIGAWIYPLTAFFIFWQGIPTGLAVNWLPWIFLSVNKTVRRISLSAVAGLSLLTCLALVSGNIDVAGQVLLGSGLYAIWCLWHEHFHNFVVCKLSWALAMLATGWSLGFMLAAPHLLPLLEYAQTGVRMVHRSEGTEDRPPFGLAAAPQVILPLVYGDSQKGSVFVPPLFEPNLLESPAAGYCGLLATLLVAPLAWCSRRHRAVNFFWLFLALFGLSWCLNFLGVVSVLRLPGLNMMSHNRLVFLTAFGIVCLAATGLDALWRGHVKRHTWFWLPAGLLAGLAFWCLHLAGHLPEPVATQIEQALGRGETVRGISGLHDLRLVQGAFIESYTIMALLCVMGFLGWLLLWLDKSKQFRLFQVMVIFMLGELLWFDYGRNPQCSPGLYYPKIPALEAVAKSMSGRVIGFNCLFAPMAEMAGLHDIRGYDAIDTASMVTVLETTDTAQNHPSYAATMRLLPRGKFIPPENYQLPPVLDMLNVRYIIFRGIPPKFMHPAFRSEDYWVLVNSNALPRVFVPETVKTLTNDSAVFQQVTAPEFNAAIKTFVEAPVQLPAACSGHAEITNEIPTHIVINTHMSTAGLVVLADNWDKGWHALYNGKPVPILRANYTIRGVVVPAGDGKLEFVYRPASLILGLWLAGFAALVLLLSLAIGRVCCAPSKAQPAGAIV